MIGGGLVVLWWLTGQCCTHVMTPGPWAPPEEKTTPQERQPGGRKPSDGGGVGVGGVHAPHPGGGIQHPAAEPSISKEVFGMNLQKSDMELQLEPIHLTLLLQLVRDQ